MAARISVDTDTWWHLRTGAWILEHGEIPQTDPFSYTRFGQDWRIPGWLVQVPMAWMYRAGGPGLLNLWVAGMVTLAFWLVYRAMDGGVFTKAFILILGAAAAGVYWAARPYMVTFVLAAAFLSILEDWRRGEADRLWWLPVLMLVWANSHGGFAVGFILWGVYLVGRLGEWANGRMGEETNGRMGEWAEGRRGDGAQGALVGRPEIGSASENRPFAHPPIRPFLYVGAVMLVAVALNPAGPRLLLYPFETVQIEALQDFIQEWQSPNFHERQVWPFAAQIFLLFGAAGISRKPLITEHFLLITAFGFLSLLAGRNIAIFSLAATVVLARLAGPVVDEVGERLGVRLNVDRPARGVRGVVNWTLAVLILLAAGLKAASVYPRAVNEAAFADFLPVGAVEYIRENEPDGRLFNAYNWGAYLLWALPEYPVFVDGRTDLYDDEVIGEWLRVVRAEPGWEEVLEEWEVGFVLIEPGYPIATSLESAGWNKAFEDETAVVLVK